MKLLRRQSVPLASRILKLETQFKKLKRKPQEYEDLKAQVKRTKKAIIDLERRIF